MDLPNELKQKIEALYFELGKKKTSEIREKLTFKYKNQTGNSESLIENEDEAKLYAVSRMPATFAVTTSLIGELIEEGLIDESIKTIADFGSGTGSGYFALKEIFENADVSLFERDKNMIQIFDKLCTENKKVCEFDMKNSSYDGLKFDMVMSSFVLSEMTESDRKTVFEKLLSVSSRYVLVIDTGTPSVYKEYMKLKAMAGKSGFSVIAPCLCKKCDLKDDYCQFYARVSRSSAMLQAKQATESYEDEKYFYLLLKKDNSDDEIQENTSACRVIRRPIIKTNEIQLKLCTKTGVQDVSITKKNKELFKKTKKCKINQIVNV